MEKTINKSRLEIRLDPESQELLSSLIARTNLTKTSLIKLALKVYASTLKKGHVYTVKLKGEVIDEKKSHNEEQIEESNPNWEEDWDKNLKELENMTSEEDSDD